MKLLLQPERNGYSVTFATEAIDVQLEGGLSRTRQDILHGAHKISVNFICNPEEYTYLMAFYRSISGRGSQAFEIDLFVEEAGIQECSAKFVPGSVSLAEQSGLSYTVNAQLEVVPPINPDQEDDDIDIVDEYNSAHT